MTTKNKSYDLTSYEEANKKEVSLERVSYFGTALSDPIFHIENYGGADDILSLKMGSDSSPNFSNRYIGFYGDGIELGSLRGYQYGSNSSGLSFIVGLGDKDFGFFAKEVNVENQGMYDSRLNINGHGNSISSTAAYINSNHSNAALTLKKMDGNSKSWVDMVTSGSSQAHTASIGLDSSGMVEFKMYGDQLAPSSGSIKVLYGDLNLSSDHSDLNINANDAINISGSEVNITSENTTITSTSSNPVTIDRDDGGDRLYISAPNLNSYYLKCGDDGGIRAVGFDDSATRDNYSFRSLGTSGDYEVGFSTTGLQYYSGNADYAEYLNIKKEEFSEFEINGKTLLPEGLIVYVREEICRSKPPGIPMVVSRSAFLVGNKKDNLDNMFSFCGQVKVIVKGPVQSGDLLVPEKNYCVAIKTAKASMEDYINSIGRAAESSEAEDKKHVTCFVGKK